MTETKVKKTRKQKPRQQYDARIIEALLSKFGFGLSYTTKCLRGDRVGIMPDKVVKEFKRLDRIRIQALNDAINKDLSEESNGRD